MATYFYRAKKGPEQIVSATIEASSKSEAAARLDALGLWPLVIEEKSDRPLRFRRVSSRELIEFTHQISSLLASGSSLLNALVTIYDSSGYSGLKPVLARIISAIKDGHDFSTALAQEKRVFTPIYVSLVRAGEATGTLAESLKGLASFLEDEDDFRASLFSALTYPVIIFSVGVLTVVVLLNFVIPKIAAIFSDIGQVLPVPTRLLIGIANIFSNYWLLFFIVIALCILFLKRYLSTPVGRLRLSAMMIKIPPFGELIFKVELCRLSGTLGLLLKSALPVDKALSVAAQTVGNSYLRMSVERLAVVVTQGVSLSSALVDEKMFPPEFINVVRVSEHSCGLDAALINSALSYKKEITRRLKGLLNILEPALILAVGLIVGFVVVAMLLPIFSIDFNF